jgi:hypothetical protein
MGLNDKMYEELLKQGTEALPFMRELLAAGKYGVDQINRLDSQIVTLASNLGKKASTELYQAGVDAAQALVNGLEAQQDKLVAMMEKIAKAMVDAINRVLGKGEYQLVGTGGKVTPIAPIKSLPVSNPKTTPKLSSASSSYSLAAGTSKAIKGTGAVASTSTSTTTKSITYNQYNSSPKALAAADVYRQTKNQLSTVKGA